MTRKAHHIIATMTGVATVLAVAAAAAAPVSKKKPTAKKPAPKSQAVAPSTLPHISSFMIYDIGTLRMTGKTVADYTFSVGPLQLTGRGPTTYSIGTLSMTGSRSPEGH
jgi:hypothetical protein